MLIVDDVLFFPAKGMMWIFREIHKAAQQEVEGERESVIARLSQLYMTLETGKIEAEEFESREKELLDLLEHLENEESTGEEEVPLNQEPVEETEDTQV